MRTKEELPECPVATAVSLIGGKWKLLLLRNLKERPWRFNELQRSIDGISQKVLTESLRQMIDDGLAYRRDYHENPPKVEYGLTDLGTECYQSSMHLQTLAITINQSLIGHNRYYEVGFGAGTPQQDRVCEATNAPVGIFKRQNGLC